MAVMSLLLTWYILLATVDYKETHYKALGIRGAHGSSSPPQYGTSDPLVRDTLYGKVRGTLRTLHFLGGQQVERYLGIPYASPPVRHLRFEPPAPPEAWQGVRDTREVPKACPQTNWHLGYLQMHVPEFTGSDMDEDCLYLNVYVPATAGKETEGEVERGEEEEEEGRPVLIHVHGGSNVVGMGAMFHGDVIATLADVIVVTFNYRLGYFGFMSDHSSDFPGNYGMHDQVEAFRWVSKNIRFFGGDPAKVTIQGHSAGGSDVGHHVLSPLSKGLFRFAVMMSGSPLAYWGVNNASGHSLTASIRQFAHSAGCEGSGGSMADIKACLKTRSWRSVNSATFYLAEGMIDFGPVVDGHFVPVSPELALRQLPLNGEAFMVGVTNDEGSRTAEIVEQYEESKQKPFHFDQHFADNYHLDPFTVFGHVPHFGRLLHHEYKDWQHPDNVTADRISVSQLMGDVTFVAPAVHMAELLSAGHDHVYFYTFSHLSRLSQLQPWMGVPHGTDMFYLFGCPLSGHPLHHYTELDMKVSRAVIDLWGNFVRHGRPFQSGQMSLPAFKKGSKAYFDITSNGSDVKIRLDADFRTRQVAFWNSLLPALLLAGDRETSERQATYRTLTWVFIALTSLLLVLVGLLIIGVLYFKRIARERCVVHATDEKCSVCV